MNMQCCKRSLLCLFTLQTIWGKLQCFETREKRLLLNDDGTLQSTEDTPNCRSGTTIDLIGYSYRQIQCHYVDGCHVLHEESLSPAAEFLLHTMCSGKEGCVNMSFPLRSKEQTALTNAVNIKYTCRDRRTFINICVDKVTEVNDTVYIMTDDTATHFEECQCWVNKGYFTLNISDVRLTNKNGLRCSSTVLLINGNRYECEEASGSFGSVFDTNIIRSSKNAFISVKLNSSTVTPDMIEIAISPEESAKIICETKNPLSTSSPEVDPRDSNTQSFWSSTTVSPEFTTYNEEVKKNVLSERELYLIATIVILGFAMGLCTANKVFKRVKEKRLRWPCCTHGGSTPDSSHNPDTSQLETGTRNTRITGPKPEERAFLLEEDQEGNSVGHNNQKNMKTFNVVGKASKNLKHDVSIEFEMTAQKGTLLPKPELPAKNIGRRNST